MSLISTETACPTAASRAGPRRRVIHCEECGYDLRGAPIGARCPECGHVGHEAPADSRPGAYTAWCRSVFVGLALLLGLTFYAISSVLVQPFEEIGGTAPALNVPGPKLWAMPLLQRPIGRSPELPGVVGTRTAMLSLLAVWLITAPGRLSRFDADDGIRRAARWVSVVLFGLAFGLLMGAQGLWPSELPPFRLLLVAGVELPSAFLIYLYLHRLATHVPGRDRRAAFSTLTWLVPLVILAGVVVLGVQWWYGDAARRRPGLLSNTAAISMGTVYGAIAVAVGVAATAAVGSLAAAFFQAAFPFLRGLGFGRFRVHPSARAMSWLTTNRLIAGAIAVGAMLMIVAMILGIDRILWIERRAGAGGNLPFVNFPGPKVWATAVLTSIGNRYGGYSWHNLLDRFGLLAINVVAIWLLSAGARPGWLRSATRWLPVIMIGGALGAVTASRDGAVFGVHFYGLYSSRFYTVVAAFIEIPTTALLYAMCAQIALARKRTGLARAFVGVAVVMVALVGISALTFVSPPAWVGEKQMLHHVLLIAALYGSAALTAAAWATGCLLRLAAVAAADFLNADGPPVKKDMPVSIDLRRSATLARP